MNRVVPRLQIGETCQAVNGFGLSLESFPVEALGLTTWLQSGFRGYMFSVRSFGWEFGVGDRSCGRV